MDREIKINKKKPSYLERQRSSGLFIGFIYVIAFMSILSLGIWQTFESENNQSILNSIDERISLIEEQINIVDETNNDSMTDITSSIQFLDKEIRKLWDLSNKRNKVNIEKISSQLKDLDKSFISIEKDVKKNQLNLISIKEGINSNISKINELGLSSEDLQSLRLSLNSINTQLMLLDDSVEALNNYKNQLNQVILEIQTQVSNIQNEPVLNN
tara:strand:+ start:513 stop:1154 length:642 start_codon:yes stop_codon:yes gene_type:complete